MNDVTQRPLIPSPPASGPDQSTPRVDAALVGLVLVFGVAVGSFAAGNSDLWLHLATGRLLARGEYRFGTDPFAFTTGDVGWVNHAWLFDLMLYFGFRAAGGPGLVALKAAGVAILAGAMLRAARGSAVWLAAGCTVLSLAAMSPRLQLQPGCASIVLLGVCLALLREGGTALLGLPAVMAVWGNVDAWFLLGPVLVAAYRVGTSLAPGPAEPRVPWWLVPACLLACLLGPYHVYGLTLPAELSPAVRTSSLARDERFAGLFASPWGPFSRGRAGGPTLADWAFLGSLALGLVSFAANRRAVRGWRGVVWGVFAALACWQARLVPFFAVVAGPITAMNLGEALPATLGRTGRFGVAVLTAGLLLVTVPGWLHGFHRRDRGFSWEVRADPSLESLGRTLAGWRRDGTLPPGRRVFAMHPDVAHYLAWFDPGEPCFLDSRFQLFPRVADDFSRICGALDPGLRHDPGSTPTPDVRPLLRREAIGCLVMYDPDRRRLGEMIRRLAAPDSPWELVAIEGQALVVVPAGESTGVPASVRFDPDREAFSPTPAGTFPAAPETGPGRLAPPDPSWYDLPGTRPPSSRETATAAVALRFFAESGRRDLVRHRGPVLGRFSGDLLGCGTQPPFVAGVNAAARFRVEPVFLPDLGERSPALPLLSIRAGRAAVAANPDDAEAWLVLGQAYLALLRSTPEATGDPPAPLAHLRFCQLTTALTMALSVRPDLDGAHEALALAYAEKQFLDLALRHREAQSRLVRAAGPQPEESADDFAGRVDRLDRAVEQVRYAVEESQNRYAVRSQPLAADPLARARLAVRLGLCGKAIDDVLLRSTPDLYGADGVRLLLDLLLLTGRAQDARDLLDRAEMRQRPDGLGVQELPGDPAGGWRYRFQAYHWFDGCQRAAAGDYADAVAAFRRLSDRLARDGDLVVARVTPELALRVTSEIGLRAGAGPPASVVSRADRERLAGALNQARFVAAERADLHTLAGMLRLESARPDLAAEEFRFALGLCPAAADAPAVRGKPLATRALGLIRSAAPPRP